MAVADRGRGGVHEAYRRLRRTGCCHSQPGHAIAQLKEIGDYLDTTDPALLGAAFLLEQEGYERAYEVLALFDPAEAS